MKFVILFLFALPLAQAYEMRLHPNDQRKLAHFLNKVSSQAKKVQIQETAEGAKQRDTVFPKEAEGPFRAQCTEVYYNDVTYPSSATCKVVIDENHQQVNKGYDEFKIDLPSSHTVKGLYQAMGLRDGEREFRTGGRGPGTSFEGKETTVFDLFWTCLPESCSLRFSQLIREEL